MKIKTAELTGLALRYAVGLAQGGGDLRHDTVATWWMTLNGKEVALQPSWAASMTFCPDIDWATGGRIIDREDIDVLRDDHDQTNKVERFAARKGGMVKHPQRDAYFWCVYRGPTKLIAAMRCLVGSNLGEEVDVPDVLLEALS